MVLVSITIASRWWLWKYSKRGWKMTRSSCGSVTRSGNLGCRPSEGPSGSQKSQAICKARSRRQRIQSSKYATEREQWCAWQFTRERGNVCRRAWTSMPKSRCCYTKYNEIRHGNEQRQCYQVDAIVITAASNTRSQQNEGSFRYRLANHVRVSLIDRVHAALLFSCCPFRPFDLWCNKYSHICNAPCARDLYVASVYQQHELGRITVSDLGSIYAIRTSFPDIWLCILDPSMSRLLYFVLSYQDGIDMSPKCSIEWMIIGLSSKWASTDIGAWQWNSRYIHWRIYLVHLVMGTCIALQLRALLLLALGCSWTPNSTP